MAASVIAAELGMDLFRIDLSKVVGRYIGETEKNLERVFEAAGVGQLIVLFDEADALFGKRTEVKNSNDRYANLEVNYLLHRIEAFEGITILTTNLEKNIDGAFRRRLRFLVELPFPTVEERERLWRTLLPERANVRGTIPFEDLAEFELAGGNISSAVLRAAFSAAARRRALALRSGPQRCHRAREEGPPVACRLSPVNGCTGSVQGPRVLGTEPSMQGRGLGTAVTQPILDEADRLGQPCFVDTAVPRNVRLYTRLGFNAVAEADFPDGPRMWAMTRAPRRAPLDPRPSSLD